MQPSCCTLKIRCPRRRGQLRSGRSPRRSARAIPEPRARSWVLHGTCPLSMRRCPTSRTRKSATAERSAATWRMPTPASEIPAIVFGARRQVARAVGERRWRGKFITEGGTPTTTAWFLRMVQRTGRAAKLPFPVHPHMCCAIQPDTSLPMMGRTHGRSRTTLAIAICNRLRGTLR